MPREIEDSVVVITGASSGIGRATALAFAEQGASVALAARSEETLREVADECESAGGQALVVPTDVTDEEAVRELARRTVERFGRIDTWVNNAGVMVYGFLEEVPSEAYRQVIETNLFGQIHGARAVVPYFKEQASGVLINISSMWAKVSSPYVSAYVTSKFGILGFSECLRQGLHDQKDIHVCTILPVSVDTPIFRHAGNYTDHGAKPVPPVLDPGRVVKQILRNARRPRPETTVGPTGYLLTFAHAVTPKLYDFLVPYVFQWGAFSSESVEQGPGNVFEPMPEWNRVSGGWRSGRGAKVRRAALAGGAVLTPLLAWWLTQQRGLERKPAGDSRSGRSQWLRRGPTAMLAILAKGTARS
ncbi:MAG TPA: SDR family oxidoreductase [Rubrobacter sp.]|nr:SDR family oxidoreductase [Rubrobacter sp.]